MIGAGPAGLAAAAILSAARVIARPEATAWHAETGRIWIETASGIDAVPFTHLLLCADEPLLLHALGCTFSGDRPVVDGRGDTSVDGVFAAGRILGATIAGKRPGKLASPPRRSPACPSSGRDRSRTGCRAASAERLDPLTLRLCSSSRLGPSATGLRSHRPWRAVRHLTGLVAPARPVGFIALAAAAPAKLDPREPQQDAASLSRGRAA